MRKKQKVNISTVLIYAALSFTANCLTSLIVLPFVLVQFQQLIGKIPAVLLIIIGIPLCVLFALIPPILFTWLFFRSVVPSQYYPSEDKFHWIKSCIRLILPAEITRFVICFISLGHINSAGMFALLPTLFFENTYLLWTGRTYAVRTLLEYTAADFLVYAVCYLPYAAIYLCFVSLVYRRFWLVGKKEREELIIHKDEVNYY